MPRKRTIPDQALLDAALAVVHESGPDALTFSALSARVGLAPSTIVQRFGTKAGLLRAALSQAWDRLDDETAIADRNAGPGAGGVVDMLLSLTGQYDAHDFADQLLVLREDLRDPVLRARGQAWLATLTAAIERRLEPANGRTDGSSHPGGRDGVDGLGELIVTHWQGTLTIWSFRRHVALTAAVRTALEHLLARLDVDRG